ncbi:MAG: PAS domain S-box protein [Candidatus Eremiobacteraeota bacterium]|nr:PAS domain S-box protein [Candidatus Eremiobacteraeota bacterium]
MDIGRTLPADITHDLLDEVLSFKALYEALVRVADSAVIELDERQRIVRFNPAAETMTGYSALSLAARPLSDITDPCPSQFLPASPDAPITGVRFRIMDTTGAYIGVNGRAIALVRGDSPEGWILAFSSNRKIDEIEQLKNELVSTVSHELKTPLATIKAYTSTLRQNSEVLHTQRDEFLAVVEQQADRLSRLIDDMLLVSRVEAAQMLRRRVMTPVEAALDRVLAEVTIDPARFTVVCRAGDARISGDPERIHDILRNVIENAVKYSPNGGTIAIDASSGGETTIVTVRDEGIGIADEHLPYIFDRFYRVESDLTSRTGGSGLGLFIVNALVRAHGGTIDVRSSVGEGTAITLTFPVRQ